MIEIGIILIRSQCVVLPLHVWAIIAAGLFQSTGKSLQAGFLGLTRQVFSFIPCVIILSKVFGLNGLAYAQATADVVSFIIALAFVIPMLRSINGLMRTQISDIEGTEGIAG